MIIFKNLSILLYNFFYFFARRRRGRNHFSPYGVWVEKINILE